MHSVTLKDGTRVDIRDADEVTTRGRRGIQAIGLSLQEVLSRPGINAESTVAELGLTEEQADAMFRMQEATLVALIVGWSREEPIPTLATIGDLPSALYDELSAVTATTGAKVANLDMSSGTVPDPKDLSGSSEL